ncbi:MAG: hypothetical protein PWQ54_2196, partial [Bacteroidales bacterium]|nr:hypothetical protein [Bacteroidales bacterium]
MRQKLRLMAVMVMMLLAFNSWGQEILTFEFSGLSGNEETALSNFNNSNLSSSEISRGTGLTASNNSGRYNATNWALENIGNAVAGDKYMEFTISPTDNYQFAVSSIYIQLQRSSTGPRGISIRSSIDNYASNLDQEYSIIDNTSTQNFTFTFEQTNSSNPVTYRVYMWAEAIGGSGGIGDGAGNDIIVIGTVTSVSGNQPPSITNIAQTPSAGITSSTTVSVAADATDSDGSINLVELKWGTTSGDYSGGTINMTNGGSGDTYTTITDIPAQADGTTVYYVIEATDDEPATTTSAEQSYAVTDPATTILPYNETFDTDLGDVYTISVSGDTKFWQWDDYSSNGFAVMNGHNSGDLEEDWMILPGIDMNAYGDVTMEFVSAYNYGSDDATNYLKLYYSTDYAGIGDPSTANWTELSFTQPSSGNYTWTNSGIIDLTTLTGNVWLGFKYHYSAGSYRTWEIDDISIQELASPIISVTPTNLSGFTYMEGSGPSASQSFTVEGVNLTSDITITPPANYEISSDDVSFQSTAITLTQTAGSVATTTLYTRLEAGLSAGDYNGQQITAASTDATNQTVTLDG